MDSYLFGSNNEVDHLRSDWYLFDMIYSNDTLARGHIMNWRTFKSVGVSNKLVLLLDSNTYYELHGIQVFS